MESTKPIHLYFTKQQYLNVKHEEFKERMENMPRKIVFATSWEEVIEFLKYKPASICVNASHIEGQSFVEVLSMIETVAHLVGCDNNMSITLGVNKDTPYSLIKEAQKSNILGIIPSTVDFGGEEGIKGITAQWAGIPYWPKNILDRLPGAKKTPNKPGNISLTNRQRQIFDIVTTKGCSNKHIAKIMGISESTVKLHMSAILKKYGVKTRTQLAVFSKTN